jgi:hypothetical protein
MARRSATVEVVLDDWSTRTPDTLVHAVNQANAVSPPGLLVTDVAAIP